MARRAPYRAFGVLALAGALMGCAMGEDPAEVAKDVPFVPVYKGVKTRLLDGDLVSFGVSMRGARDAEDLAAYGECAAAQYTLIRGYGFARHVRTNVEVEGGLWRGDAVYTISPDLPRGARTIDAEVTVQSCAEQGIPTV